MIDRDGALERALADLRRHVELPATPDIAAAVVAEIRTRGPRRIRAPYRRRVAWALAACVVAAGLGLSLSRDARDAVAGFPGIGGVRIAFGSGPSPAASPSTESHLPLGRPVTLDDARAEVDFRVVVPHAGGIARPDHVYVAGFPPGGSVSLVYDADDSLPEASATGIGLVVTEFEASLEPELVKKVIGTQATLRPTRVGDDPAYWIQGPHTVFFYRDRTGAIRQSTVRIAGNTLLWEHDGVTLRIESALDLARARRVAESMH